VDHLTEDNERNTERPIPFDPDAMIFVIPLLVLGVILSLIFSHWLWVVWVPIGLSCFAILAFFRDPRRSIPDTPNAIVSPADGKIVAIEPNRDNQRGPVPGHRITIFLSVLNCHINRAPCDGFIERLDYVKGKFLNALDAESSEVNECNWIYMRCSNRRITVRQIAGLIARRIVCRVREGDEVVRGGKLGLIRFGSRTELYLPAEANLKVHIGSQVRGGLTIIAVLPEEEFDPTKTRLFMP